MVVFAKPLRSCQLLSPPALLVGSWVLFHASPADGLEASVQADSQLQLYSVRSPFGAPILSRQRLIHQLSLDALGEPPSIETSPVSWAFHARLRLDGDYGIEGQERDPALARSFIPGLATSPVDLSYGYISVSGLAFNTTDIAIGRQITFNALGFWSYDGAKVSFAPGALFDFSLFAGYEQRGGVPLLSSSRYEADGVYRGNREGMQAAQWPSYLNSTAMAPAVGTSISLLAVRGLRARVDYRRVTQSDRVVTLPFADANGQLETYSGKRVSSDKLGVGAGYDLASRASFDGTWVYDVYQRKTQEHRAFATFRPSDTWRTTVSYQYRVPLFDADSIFNWFGARGNVTVSASATYQPVTAYQMTLTVGGRWLGVGPRQLFSEALSVGPDGGTDAFFRLDSSYFAREFSLGSGTIFEAGAGGKRYSSDLWYRRSFFEHTFESAGMLSAGSWQHSLLPDWGQGSVMYVVGVRLFPRAPQQLGAEWEHVLAQGPSQRFRVLATATARFP